VVRSGVPLYSKILAEQTQAELTAIVNRVGLSLDRHGVQAVAGSFV